MKSDVRRNPDTIIAFTPFFWSAKALAHLKPRTGWVTRLGRWSFGFAVFKKRDWQGCVRADDLVDHPV